MKNLHTILLSVILVCSIQTLSAAQTTNVTETFKKHFNETVQQVQNTESADDKRTILEESFNKMIIAIDRIQSATSLTESELADIETLKHGITEKLNELKGLDGFNRVSDEDLGDFSDYSQDFIEQANRTLTIGLGTALLIIIILLLI